MMFSIHLFLTFVTLGFNMICFMDDHVVMFDYVHVPMYVDLTMYLSINPKDRLFVLCHVPYGVI